MTHPYEVALIVTIDAESYEDALQSADALAEGIGCEGENISAVLDYKRDSNGRRVLHFPND
jgi:hypothetical protein